MSTIRNLTFAEVQEGQELPPLSHPVTATTVVLGALASRDWQQMHHDRDFAQNRNGTKDIFINTPTNVGWFQRYVTDWAGPKARMGRIKFKMKTPVFPHDTMVISGHVAKKTIDETGCCWINLELTIKVGETLNTECQTRFALPANDGDNPWQRRGDRWKP